jgi:hypothetical protein
MKRDEVRKWVESAGGRLRDWQDRPEAFGSWTLIFKKLNREQRIIWDGKDGHLIIQSLDADALWCDQSSEKLDTMDPQARIRHAVLTLFPDAWPIGSPQQFYDLMNCVCAAMAADILVLKGGNCNPADIQKGKPWPNDVIEMQFQHRESQRCYRVVCETYHGAGGRWEAVP